MFNLGINGLGGGLLQNGYTAFPAPDGSGTCVVADSGDIFAGNEAILNSAFVNISKDHPGYDPVCDCYCWGYMPERVQIIGLGNLGGAYPGGWRICMSNSNFSSSKRCLSPPKPVDCPTCPKPPPCPTLLPAETSPSKGVFGISLGWWLAAAAVGGGSYYAYKKGAFKRKKR